MSKVLLISESTIKKVTLINDNVSGSYLLPAIQTAQDIDLETAIGPALVRKLQDLVASGEIANNELYKKLLDEYVTPFLCWATMTNIQLNLNYKFSNSGMIQNYDDKKAAIDYSNGKALEKQYEYYQNSYGMKLKNYLCSNSSKYPEYHQCVEHQGAEELPLCGIFLEDIPSRSHDYKYK